MDSRVVQSVAHENDEHYPHIVASEQVTQGAEEDQFDHEKKSVLNKVKAKAKKIKDTIKKHGHQVLDRGHEYNNEDQHTLDDHDLDEDDEMVEDPQVHKTPIHESEDVKTATPTSEQVENLGKSGIDSGGTTGTTVMGEEPRHDALLGSVSSTTEIDQNTATDSAKTSSVEEKAGQPKDNLEKSIGLDWEKEPHPPGSRPEAYPPTNYQTKITDPSVIEKDEIEKITPVEESFAKMNVHDVPKPTPEPNIQPTVVDSEYPPVGNHDQFVPHLSAATQTQYPSAESHDQFNQETTSTNINRNLENPTETGQAFNAGQPKDNLEKSIGLDWEKEPQPPGSRPEAYPPTNYQTKITDPSVIEKDEIEKITPVEESFAKMNVHDVPKPTPEPNIQPTVVDSEYPPVGNHDQFVPNLSAATQTQYPSAESHDQFNQETTSTNINRNMENPTETGQTFNTITTTVEEKPLYEAKIDDVVSPKDVIASEAGSGEKDAIKDKVVTNEEQQKIGDASNMSGSTAQHGKNIAYSLTEKLAPVYDKVAGVGSAVKSKVTGTSTGGVVTETKNEVSVKDYLAEKLKPGEEDKALSEVISEALHKKKEEPVKNEDGNLDGGEESSVKSPGKGVVGKLKGVVGSWFGNAEEKGGEDLSKNTNSGAEVEQVHQVVGEIKSSPIEEQGTG